MSRTAWDERGAQMGQRLSDQAKLGAPASRPVLRVRLTPVPLPERSGFA